MGVHLSGEVCLTIYVLKNGALNELPRFLFKAPPEVVPKGSKWNQPAGNSTHFLVQLQGNTFMPEAFCV